MLMQDRLVVLEVADNGSGFDASKPRAIGDAIGILGMRERALLAGGELEIHSAPGAGTLVRVRLPSKPENRREFVS
jgi:signal transduction histidine kinase